MSKTLIPLFWKFTIGIVIVVVSFSFFTIAGVWNMISDSLERELSKRGSYIAKNLAEKSLSYILYDNLADLNNLIDQTIRIDSNIAYVFIVNKNNKVIAHSFEQGFPNELIKANFLNNQPISIVLVQPDNFINKYIRDIAVPVLDQRIGIVRVGLYEDQIRTDINSAGIYFIIIISIFLLVSLLAAFLYSYIITVPVKFISQMANEINLDSFQNILSRKNVLEKSFSYRIRKLFFAHDEIDILYNKFIEMIERLQKTHEELQSTNKSLLNSEKLASIGVLASGIAHEINNPIAGLQNCMRRITAEPGKISQNIEYFELMNDAVEQIEKVVKGLLHFSYKHEFSLSELNIIIPVEKALLLSAYLIDKSEIKVINEISEDFPLINGSENHLEQVFLNLILNSVHAIVQKNKSENKMPGIIKIYGKYDSSLLYVTIEDNGIGIKKPDIDKIFDVFFTTKEPGQGTGLGLSIAFKFIKQHGGEIKVNSEYGIGTKITIILPLKHL